MTTLPPPEHLSDTGRAFWVAIAEQYDLEDADQRALLEHAATALERIEAARKAIAEHGLVLDSGRANPAVNIELQYVRAFRMACREMGLSTNHEQYTRPPRPAGNRAAGRTD
ncbi:MAG: P27 family phage terminase small subunit [Phycisphaeraceae bacterium]